MPKKTISKDTPLADITLRRYEKPSESTERDLVRKLCLSLGLLQPGDSRDVIVDILYVLLSSKKSKEELDSLEIEKRVVESRNKNKLPLAGIASSNIRRQLKRLKGMFLVESAANRYRIAEFASLSETFEEKIERFLLPSIISRLKDYLKKIDEKF